MLKGVNGRKWRLSVKNAGGNYIPFAGAQEESLSFGLQAIDVTDKESDGYRHMLSRGGRSVDLSLSGVAIANEGYAILLDAVDANEFIEMRAEAAYEILEGEFHVSSFRQSGSHDQAVSFSASFQSTAPYTYLKPEQAVADYTSLPVSGPVPDSRGGFTVLIDATTANSPDDQVLWQRDDGTEQTRIRIVLGADGELRLQARDNGNDRADILLGEPHGVFSVNTSVDGGIASSLNGEDVKTDGSSAPLPLTHERFGIATGYSVENATWADGSDWTWDDGSSVEWISTAALKWDGNITSATVIPKPTEHHALETA